MPDPGLILPCVLNRRWQVLEKLAQGGMGKVFLATDLNLSKLGHEKRLCIVKQLRDDFFHQEDRKLAVKFFLREAQVLSTLNHPNIVAILDFFQEEENFYLVLEYVRGKNLEEMMLTRDAPFDSVQVIKWAIQISEVLHYLHTYDPPIIYRDLKPSNIMIDEHNQLKLVDFGIARPFEENQESTLVISQGYSPPEQYQGATDPRSDVYALGCTMFFCLTGKDSRALTVSNPQKLNPAVSEELGRIVQKATQQDMESRFQSALEIEEELTSLSQSLHSPSQSKPLLIIKTPWLVVAGVAFIAILIISVLASQKIGGEAKNIQANKKTRTDSHFSSTKTNSNSKFHIRKANSDFIEQSMNEDSMIIDCR